MPLNIRDDQAVTLARELAKIDGSNMTNAVITALKETLAARRRREPLWNRVERIADALRAKSKSREITPVAADDFWETM